MLLWRNHLLYSDIRIDSLKLNFDYFLLFLVINNCFVHYYSYLTYIHQRVPIWPKSEVTTCIQQQQYIHLHLSSMSKTTDGRKRDSHGNVIIAIIFTSEICDKFHKNACIRTVVIVISAYIRYSFSRSITSIAGSSYSTEGLH